MMAKFQLPVVHPKQTKVWLTNEEKKGRGLKFVEEWKLNAFSIMYLFPKPAFYTMTFFFNCLFPRNPFPPRLVFQFFRWNMLYLSPSLVYFTHSLSLISVPVPCQHIPVSLYILLGHQALIQRLTFRLTFKIYCICLYYNITSSCNYFRIIHDSVVFDYLC